MKDNDYWHRRNEEKMYKQFTMELAGRTLRVDIGRVCAQANGAALMHYGDTVVLSTATASKEPREGIDFFPLSVEYEEKMYAVGKIPGGFNKREGKASENAILTSRVIDRPMRPLFPKDYRNDVTLNNMVMSVDTECRPELLAMLGSSIATCISDIPFDGPCATTQIGLVDGEFIINPSQSQWQDGDLQLTVASTKQKVIMIEAGANEIPEAKMIEAIYMAHDINQTIIEFCNANDGGWSAFVPIQSLVDAYETSSGLTIEEAEKNGEYDPVHPYKNRDPRFYATVLYSGADWVNPNGVYRIYNTLDRTIDGKPNKDNANDSRNASQSGYTCCKYMSPLTQYSDINNTGLDFIVFRYAEVLLSKAEALIELNRDLDEACNLMDEVRKRAGMPMVDRNKYSTQATLRELLRRERRVEFAFEGLRRSDIVRWGIAKEVLNGPIYATNYGTVIMDTNIPQEERVVIKTGEENKVVLEIRSFKNTYLPIPQSELDRNPNLVQTNFE